MGNVRRCPFRDCKQTIPAEKFACYRHWLRLGTSQRTVIWDAFHEWLAGRLDGDGLREIQEKVLKEVETGTQAEVRVEACNSCGAPILWYRTTGAGRMCPIDADPCPDGNIVIREGWAFTLKDSLFDESGQPREGEVRYKTHFATCPHSAAHKKKGKKK